MGMYTELVIKAEIMQHLPYNVGIILDYLFNPNTEIDIYDEDMKIKSDIKLPNHHFFSCSNWDAIGRCSFCYHIPERQSFFDGDYLFSRSDLKDYDNEIEQFINWITPYLDEPEGKFIGWIWYEEWAKPTFIYKNGKYNE